MRDIKDQVQKNLDDIKKELEQEKDVLLKYDKKKGVVKIYSQDIKKIG